MGYDYQRFKGQAIRFMMKRIVLYYLHKKETGTIPDETPDIKKDLWKWMKNSKKPDPEIVERLRESAVRVGLSPG